MGHARVTTAKQRFDDGCDGGRVPYHAPNIENRRTLMLTGFFDRCDDERSPIGAICVVKARTRGQKRALSFFS
jgi:hypothetical protein